MGGKDKSGSLTKKHFFSFAPIDSFSEIIDFMLRVGPWDLPEFWGDGIPPLIFSSLESEHSRGIPCGEETSLATFYDVTMVSSALHFHVFFNGGN